jgi:hypothetical protein
MLEVTDLKACFILESLQNRVADCEVDYLSYAGVHRFSVKRDRTKYEVGVHERVLAGFQVEDLKRFLTWLSEHIVSDTAPHRVVIACA